MYTHSQVCMYPAQVEQTGSGVSSEVGRRTHYSAYGGNLIFASGSKHGILPHGLPSRTPLITDGLLCYYGDDIISNIGQRVT